MTKRCVLLILVSIESLLVFYCWYLMRFCPPQGMLTLLSRCIDRMNLYNSAAHFAEKAGEEAGAAWKDILNLLYELLGKGWSY